jgi:hypothetical protein
MPKWQRILALTYQHNKQNIIRIRYDWGRELVVITSTGILLGLFYYIFHDFLQSKLSDLPAGLRLSIADRLIGAVLLGLGLWVTARLQNLFKDEPGWAQFALRSGEVPAVVAGFRRLQALIILVFSFGFFWVLVAPPFVQWSLAHCLLLQTASLGLGVIFHLLTRNQQNTERKQNLKPILNDEPSSRRLTLRSWRWFQMLRRNRFSRLCLALSLLVQLLIGIMHSLAWPLFLTVLATMLASALLAWAVAFQLEEDMRAVWFERQLGCSHEEFVAVYQQLCWMLGLAMAALTFFLLLIGGVPARDPLSEWLKLLPIAALFPLITPSIMFQVAPDRPLLQILISSLIGLFLGTAIYAHILSIIAVAMAIHYAKNYQKDNFYRS